MCLKSTNMAQVHDPHCIIPYLTQIFREVKHYTFKALKMVLFTCQYKAFEHIGCVYI